MNRKIILNIPHSSIEGVFDGRNGWVSDIPLLQKKVNKWTDWFTDYLFSRQNPGIIMQRCPLSRFVVDVERLPDDPMEAKGQGIVFTEFEGIRRSVTEERRSELTAFYHDYRTRLGNLVTGPDDVLVDCHSFPSELAPDVDICIGYNEDWSRPSDKFLEDVQEIFAAKGFIARFNEPYSNSITPESEYEYKSFMIEINKRCYMDETRIEFIHRSLNLMAAIDAVYGYILADYPGAEE